MSTRNLFVFTCVVGGIAAHGPVSVESILPILPPLVADFGAEPGAAQISIGMITFGIALGQIPFGPLADRFGRKPILFGGLSVIFATSIAIMFVTSIEAFYAVRFIQGFAIASCIILSRTMVRDIFDREAAAKLYSYLMVIMGMTSMLSPIIGGKLYIWFGWQIVFLYLALFSLLFLTLLYLLIDETLPRPDFEALKPRRFVGNLGTIASNRIFVSYLLVGCLAIGSLNSFLASSAPIFVGHFGLRNDVYGYYFSAVAAGAITGSFIGTRIVARLGLNTVLAIGLTLLAASGTVMTALPLFGVDRPAAVAIPMFFMMTGFTLSLPQVTAGALSPFPHIAGVASSFMGVIQFAFGAMVSIFLGWSYNGTQMPMAISIMTNGILALVLFAVLVRPATRGWARA